MSKEETFLLAVYGSLRAGYFNSPRLRHSEYLGDIKTDAKYTMRDIGGYPAILPRGETAIHCEVYRVNRRAFMSIGRMEMSAGYEIKAINTKYGKACLYVYAYDDVANCREVIDGNWKQPTFRLGGI